jgi:hypothetical protein
MSKSENYKDKTYTPIHRYQQEGKYGAIRLSSAPSEEIYHQHSMLQQRSYMQTDTME